MMEEIIKTKAEKMKCSLEVAAYILKLEVRLLEIEESIEVRHDRMIEAIDHLEMVTQRHLEE